MYKDGAESKGSTVSSQSLASVFSSMTGAVLNVSAGKVLAAQGDEVRGIFRIERGYIRLCVYTKEGTRRIVAFYGPGAILGIDQLNSPRWNVAVEALTQCVVIAVPKAQVNRRIEGDSLVREGAMLALHNEIELREAHLVMMGILPSSERVFTFLSAFAEMRGHDGFLVLPMCRRDIGDYLGLSMETVSRSFSALKECGRIELNGAEKFRIVEKEATSFGHCAA